ncbi:MAG: hypothetical protein IJX49_06205 [Clostridia bacterium]|nr:hypothetical protein [Clostridia bacterium]
MKKLYELVGSLLHLYQNIENDLSFVYAYYNGINYKNDVELRKSILDLNKTTLGNKIKKLEKFFPKSENDILNYIKEQRNFLVHDFFIDETINSSTQILDKKEQLLQMLNDAKLIEKALRGLIKDLQNAQ